MEKMIVKLVLIGTMMALLSFPVLAVDIPEEVTQCTMRHDLTGTTWTDKGVTCPAKDADCPLESEDYTCGTCCLFDSIYTVTDWIFIFVVLLVIIFVLMGAFNILTAAGNTDKVTLGRNYIMYAALGMIVALIARAVPGIVRALFGLG